MRMGQYAEAQECSRKAKMVLDFLRHWYTRQYYSFHPSIPQSLLTAVFERCPRSISST